MEAQEWVLQDRSSSSCLQSSPWDLCIWDLSSLEAQFRIAEIIDDTEPDYDFSALFAEHSSDMIGFFIQALQKEDMSPVEKKALYYGVNALLHTTDERS